MKIESPCYQCQRREIGCHAMCERYQAYKKALADEKGRFDEYKAFLDYNSRKKRVLDKRKGK